MARAIMRYSLAAEGTNARSEFRSRLDAAGFEKLGTASWEAVDGDVLVLVDAIRDILAILARSGSLDHLWIYLDEAG